MAQPRIAVVGSLVMDLVVWLPHLPRLHETLLPDRFEVFPGGKGFNQALTARRCGAEVTLVGRVGDDGFGRDFEALLAAEGIDARIGRDPTVGTSLGIPIVLPGGDNSIIGIPLANTRLAVADVTACESAIAAAGALILQLEVPVVASRHAAAIARAAGRLVVFNPAPAQPEVGQLLAPLAGGAAPVDWLLPNEIEAGQLLGTEVSTVSDAVEAGRALLARGVKAGVVVTLGDRGAVAVTPSGSLHQPTFPVVPVDPTGAGDAFCGAFTVGIVEGRPLPDALRFAAAAGALCVTRAGAAPSLPTRTAIAALIATHPSVEAS